MLKEIEDRLAKLEEEYKMMVEKKDRLQKEAGECEVKLDRAIKLTGGLSGEKIRWFNDIEEFKKKENLIPGNSVIGAGMVAYAGPFTSNYR